MKDIEPEDGLSSSYYLSISRRFKRLKINLLLEDKNEHAFFWKHCALLIWAVAAGAWMVGNSPVYFLIISIFSLLIFPPLLMRDKSIYLSQPLWTICAIPSTLGFLSGLILHLTELASFSAGEKSWLLIISICFMGLSPFNLARSQSVSMIWFQCLSVYVFSLSVFLMIATLF